MRLDPSFARLVAGVALLSCLHAYAQEEAPPPPPATDVPAAEAPAAPPVADHEEAPTLNGAPLSSEEMDSGEEAAKPLPPRGPILDGHPREGAFLAGPGSLAFVLHHTLLLGVGGLATQIAAHGFNLNLATREAMLAGTLIGAGLGFGVSAWWQFNHWLDQPVANFGIVNSLIGGMLVTGLVDIFSDDPTALTWTAVLSTELAAWLTTTLGGGEMPLSHGLLIASGAGWAMAYAALLLTIIGTSSAMPSASAITDTLLIAPGLGAAAMAMTTMRYSPSSAQVLRADAFGAGVGGAVLLLSALVLGFGNTTPYVLALVSSAGAITAVSLLWEESAERKSLYRDPAKDRPYRNVWW